MSIIRVAIYIRVSSDKQADEGDSIPAQRKALTEHVARHGNMVLVGEYMDDGISGTKYSQRDELQRMITDVQAGKIDLILVTKMDRLFRSIRWYTYTLEILQKHGVEVNAIWEPNYDTNTPQGRFIANQMMSIAQFEAEQTGERIRQVQRYKISQGEFISGTPPHGYKIEKKHLVPNEYAGEVLQTFQTYERTGALSTTLREIVGLNDVPRTQHKLKKMLRNPVYKGEYRGNKEFCEPIVARQLWDHVQELLGKNIKKSQKHDYLFSGLIRCGDCGKAFGAYTNRRRDGYGDLYHRYRCTGHYQSKPPACNNTKVITEHVLEKDLVSRLNDAMGELSVSYEERAKKAWENKQKIQALEHKIDRLKDLYVNDLITLEEYKADKALYSARIAELSEGADKPPNSSIKALSGLDGADFGVIYEGFTREEKRRFWRGIIKEIRFNGHRDLEVDFL